MGQIVVFSDWSLGAMVFSDWSQAHHRQALQADGESQLVHHLAEAPSQVQGSMLKKSLGCT